MWEIWFAWGYHSETWTHLFWKIISICTQNLERRWCLAWWQRVHLYGPCVSERERERAKKTVVTDRRQYHFILVLVYNGQHSYFLVCFKFNFLFSEYLYNIQLWLIDCCCLSLGGLTLTYLHVHLYMYLKSIIMNEWIKHWEIGVPP